MTACFNGSVGTAIFTWLVLTMWFSLRFPLASRRGMMTVNQMRSPHPMHPGGRAIKKGIPLTKHGSTWTCLVTLNAMLAFFVGEHLHEWLLDQPVIFHSLLGYPLTYSVRHPLLASHLGGYAVSGLAHLSFVTGKNPEADIDPPLPGRMFGKLTPAGWVHVVYFGEAVSLLFQIYLFTETIDGLSLCLLTAYMTGHIWLGNHFQARIEQPDWFEGNFWAIDGWLPVLAVLAVLTYATWVKIQRDAKSSSNSFLHPQYPIALVYVGPIRTEWRM